MIKLLFAAICIYVTGVAGTALEDTNDGDLNQAENGDSVSDIFHSSFWTSKEIKVMTKTIFTYGALLVNASYGNQIVQRYRNIKCIEEAQQCNFLGDNL